MILIKMDYYILLELYEKLSFGKILIN